MNNSNVPDREIDPDYALERSFFKIWYGGNDYNQK